MSKSKIPAFVGTTLATILLVSGICTTDRVALAKDDRSYKTTTLTYEDLIINATSEVTATYPATTSITFHSDYSTAVFVSYLVDGGSFVNEGDPIVEIRSSIDDIDLLEVKMDLERAKKDYEAYLSDSANEKKAAEQAVKDASDQTSKKIAKLELERLTMNQSSTQKSYEERLNYLEEKVATYETEASNIYITAPATGEIILPVNSRWRYHEGDDLKNNAYIGYIFETDYTVFTIEGNGSIFRYGQKLTLSDRDGNIYNAHVASCSSASLTSTLISATAIIVPEEEIPTTYYPDLVASYESVHIEHIIKVPSGSYHTDDNGTYVYLLTDNNTLMKHYFTRGRAYGDFCIALDGLTEGMVIVAK